MNKNLKVVSALALGTAISVNSVTPIIATATETNTTNNLKTISKHTLSALNEIKVTTSIDKSTKVDNKSPQSTTQVTIPDTELAKIIRTTLSKGSDEAITKDDMAKLKTLNIRNKNITNLTGLEEAINLESLDISFNAISDFKPISQLTNLKTLMAAGTTLKDLSSIEGLTGLKYLFVGMNPIKETTPLSKLTNLVGVDFTSTRITQVPDISKLTNLKHLLLDSTGITDIKSLKGSEIAELGLSYLDINDYTALKGSKVQMLYVDDAKNFDISIVNSMDFLTSISLNGIGKSKLQKIVDTLKNKEHLHNLSLSENGIDDISSILTLPQLNKTSTGEKFKLILDGNYISDFSGLKNKPNVIVSAQDQTIKLSSCRVTSDTVEIKPELKSFDGNTIKSFTLDTSELTSPNEVSITGTQDSLLIKGLKPGVHNLRINYKVGDASDSTSSISGWITQKVTVSNGLELIINTESGVNNNGSFVFIKPADKDNNIGSITTSQGDKLPATGGVVEVTENKDLTITAIDKNDESKTLEYKTSIVNIDKSGPTIELTTSKNTDGKAEISISATNQAKGLNKIILPSGKEVEFNGSVYTSKEVVENDGIYKVSAIDRAKTRVNKFIHVSDTDAKITITPREINATKQGTTLDVAINTGASDVVKVTCPDGSSIQPGGTTSFNVQENGDYTFKIELTDGSTVDYKFTVQNIDKDAPTAEVSKKLAPDGSKRYIVNISGQDDVSSIKNITVNGKIIDQPATKILTDSTDPIVYTITDTLDNSKEYIIDLEKFPTYSEIAEAVIDSNIWVPIMNTGRSEAVLYLDFSNLENIKSVKTPDGKTTTETAFEYVCTQNGPHNFEITFGDDSVYKRTVEITGLDADTITSTPGTDGTDKPGTDGTDKPAEDSKEETTDNNGNNTGSNPDKANPQTGDEGIKGYVIGFISLITLAIGGIILQKKMNKNEEDINVNDDMEDEEFQ